MRLRDRVRSLDGTLTRALTLPAGRGPAQVTALVLAHSGDIYIWAGLCVLTWFLGDAQWKVRAVVIFAGLVLAEGAVFLIKLVFKRKRPPGTSGMIYRKADPYSFPSGHAARAIMLCLLAAFLGPTPLLVAILVWSPFMVLSRIAIGIHYVVDILGGFVLGVILTAILLEAAHFIAPLL